MSQQREASYTGLVPVTVRFEGGQAAEAWVIPE